MIGKRMSQETPVQLRPLAKRDLDVLINRVAAEVAARFRSVEPERIIYLGEEILAIPMDTRRFIYAMSRYMVFN